MNSGLFTEKGERMKLVHIKNRDNEDTYIDVDHIRMLQAKEDGTLIVLGRLQSVWTPVPIEDFISALADVLNESEGE